MSAGAMCWFESGFSEIYTDNYSELPCLGVLPGIFNPHHSGVRQKLFLDHCKKYNLQNIIGLPDNYLIRFEDGHIEEIVSTNEVDNLFLMGNWAKHR